MFVSILVTLFVLFGAFSRSEAASHPSLAGEKKEHLDKFESFKKDFDRRYSFDEEARRFNNFKATLDLIEEKNAAQIAKGNDPTNGITQFADMTQEEFKKMNGFRAMPGKVASPPHPDYVPEPFHGESLVGADSGVPEKYANWIGKLTTVVKNQQQCGSCWTFGSSEQLESDAMRQLGVSVELSEGQILQCDRTSFGCQGGDPEHALQYLKATGGLSLVKDYPYTQEMAGGYTGHCQTNEIYPVITATAVYNFNQNSSCMVPSYLMGVEKAMAQYMFESGPIAITVDASSWSTYTGGVLMAADCGVDIDHSVQAVGLRTDVSPPYWIVRNSWSATWGLDGYIYLEYGGNTCGLTNGPIFADAGIVDAERISLSL